jgi:hypothetical protein
MCHLHVFTMRRYPEDPDPNNLSFDNLFNRIGEGGGRRERHVTTQAGLWFTVYELGVRV